MRVRRAGRPGGRVRWRRGALAVWGPGGVGNRGWRMCICISRPALSSCCAGALGCTGAQRRGWEAGAGGQAACQCRPDPAAGADPAAAARAACAMPRGQLPGPATPTLISSCSEARMACSWLYSHSRVSVATCGWGRQGRVGVSSGYGTRQLGAQAAAATDAGKYQAANPHTKPPLAPAPPAPPWQHQAAPHPLSPSSSTGPPPTPPPGHSWSARCAACRPPRR
jgi:hypothetical protein